MKRPSAYQYTNTEPPGVNVHRLRHARGWTLRDLSEHCRPEIHFTTLRRLELNLGYTQDTLERVARALGVKVADLFLPPELAADWVDLPAEARARIGAAVADAAAAYRYRKKKDTG